MSDIKIKQLQLYYNALFYFIVKVPVGGYCALNEQCQGNENSGVCDHGRCVCRAGYILFNLECYEGKLEMIFQKYISICIKEEQVIFVHRTIY